MIGQIILYGGSSPPSGWVECDGSSYDTTSQSALFAVIGYTYGGSGSSFNVPDLRGRVPVGEGTGAGLTARSRGQSGGAEKMTDVPEHLHQVRPACHDTNNFVGAPTNAYMAEPDGLAQNIYNNTANANMGAYNTDNAGTAGGVDQMNPYGVVKYLIKIS